MRRLLLILGLIALSPYCLAQVNATTCNTSDVQAAINTATEGQTVNIPSGTCTWTSGVTISGKGITVNGAGSGRAIAYSSSTLALGNGSLSLTVASTRVDGTYPLGPTSGQTLTVSELGNKQNFMTGTVTSFSGGSLVMNITSHGGTCGTGSSGGSPSNCARWIVLTQCSTCITHNSSSTLFSVTEDSTVHTTLQNIEIDGGSGTGDYIDLISGGGAAIVVQNMRWAMNATADIGLHSAVNRGVVSNVTCDFTPFSQAPICIDPQPFDTTAWQTSSYMGALDTTGQHNLYVETSDFEACLLCFDNDEGARTVIRYSFFNNAGIGGHGADTGPLGARYNEFYHNVGNFNGYNNGKTFPMNQWDYVRGGTFVYWDNTMPALTSTDYGTKDDINMTVMNLQRNAGTPYTACWGLGTSGGADYHAPHQVGMGCTTTGCSTGSGGTGVDGKSNNIYSTSPYGYGNQYVGDSDPAYIWGNSRQPLTNVTYSDYGTGQGDSCVGTPDTSANYIVANRDYFNGSTAKPGYSAYTYPHPLLSGGGVATCPISAGASQSTIASTITNCSSGSSVTFAAGSYSMNSSVNVPCGVTITGPVVGLAEYTGSDGYVRMGYTPTATITWTGGADTPVFQYGACSTAAAFQYMEVNGGRPSPDGGQVLYFNPGVSNFTIFGNFLHGNQGNAGSSEYFQDGLILFDGSSSGAVNNGDSVLWNRLGTNGDCSNIMNNTAYPGFAGDGGFCNGLGEHNGMNNFSVKYNVFTYNENESKFYEGSGRCVNCVWTYNDFTQWHRIAIENQSNSGSSNPTNQTIDFNSIHDANYPATGTFGLSIANGCTNVNPPPGTSSCISNVDANVIAANTPPALGPPYNRYADSIEWWGSRSTVNYNFLMGMANSIMIADDGSASVNSNLIYNPAGGVCTPGDSSGGFFNTEDSPANTATGSGNVCSSASNGTQLVSVAPTISPASGSFSGTQNWTASNSGTNRDANTNEWCTTDGSTPVPGQGTAQFYANGTGGTVSSTTTVKCVGMWGAANQPASWAPGYGYSQSAVVTATYTMGITPAATPVLTPASSTFTSTQVVTVTDSTGGSTIYCTTDGSTPTTGSPVYSGPFTFSSTTALKCIATASGFSQSAVATGVYTKGSPPPPPTGVTITLQGGGTTVLQGNSVQACANMTYASGGPTQVCGAGMDSFGYSTSNYTSSATTYATMNASSGLLTGVAAGTTDISVVVAASNTSYSPNTQSSLTGWKAVCVIGSCSGGTPGGTNTPTATSHTIGNASPSLSGSSMLFSSTSPASSTQTNALWTFLGASCDSCRYFQFDKWVYLVNQAAMSSLEEDFGNFDVTDNINFMFGGQCYFPLGKWQIANQTSSWTTTSVPCAFSSGAWHHLVVSGHASNTTEFFDFLTIDGTTTAIGLTEPTTTLPGGYASNVFYQTQIDIAGASAAQTASVYDDFANFTASNGLIATPLAITVTGITPTLTGGFQGNTGSLNSILVGGAGIQQTATGTFSDGTTHALPFAGYTPTWSSSNTAVLGVSSSGLITGVAAGSANSVVVGNPGAIPFTNWGWTVTGAPPPTPSSGYLGNPGSVNNVAIGSGMIQFTAYMCYSNLTGCNALPDAYGNSVLAWSIAAGSCGTISSSGVFTPTTPGTCNVVATCNCTSPANINQWTMTVTRAATPAPPEIEVIIISEGGAPREWQDWTDFPAYVARLRGEVGGWN